MESQSNHNKEKDMKSMPEINLKDISIDGDFNFNLIAGNNNKNLNKSSSETPSELQEKLKYLSDTIFNLTTRLEKNDAAEASKNLDLLLTEAESRSPNKAKYERYAETLIHLAQKTAELAEPATKAIQAVIKLLQQ
ncbi:hypothetical protein BXU06_14395 [Aquaspirillum sp. LM1]|nr:hypothetical protein BXU06_14395 [Aquaspirillum sp. LM1]